MFRIVVTVPLQIEGPALTSGAFSFGLSRWRPLLFVLSLLAVCSRYTASNSTTRGFLKYVSNGNWAL